jgi:hypothetical protein
LFYDEIANPLHYRKSPFKLTYNNRLESRVRAHILLCMLAYYVQSHMLEAWLPLLFSDEDQQPKTVRDPVVPGTRSQAALKKVHTHAIDDSTEAHSYRTLMKSLGSIVCSACLLTTSDTPATFEKHTTPTAKQQRAFDLLKHIKV